MKRRVRNLRLGEEKKHYDLLNLCFKPWGSERKWRRLYFQHGFDITKNVLVVEEAGEWIGGVTGWFRAAFLKESIKTKVCIAGDGYVHPNHLGKGVYSTYMRSFSDFARKEGASLGIGFISIYGVPHIALPKYGFVDVFHPRTKVLVLNPEKFLQYVIAKVEDVDFPARFEGIRIKLTISLNSIKGKFSGSRVFQLRNRKLCQINDVIDEKIDLEVSTDICMLFDILRCFIFSRRTLFPLVLLNCLKRRLRLRFSLELLKRILRPQNDR